MKPGTIESSTVGVKDGKETKREPERRTVMYRCAGQSGRVSTAQGYSQVCATYGIRENNVT